MRDTLPDAPEVAQALRATAAWIDRRYDPDPGDPYFTPGALHCKWHDLKRKLKRPVGYCAIGYAVTQLDMCLTLTSSTCALVDDLSFGNQSVGEALRRAHVNFDDEYFARCSSHLRTAAQLLDPSLSVKSVEHPTSQPNKVLPHC